MSKVFVVCQAMVFFCCDLLKPAAPGEHMVSVTVTVTAAL